MTKNNLDEWNWIANPKASNPTPEAQKLIDNRSKIKVINELNLSEDYEYDEWALIKLDKNYYVLNTSGCSCPDPNETWGIVFGPGTLSKIKKEIKDYLDKCGEYYREKQSRILELFAK